MDAHCRQTEEPKLASSLAPRDWRWGQGRGSCRVPGRSRVQPCLVGGHRDGNTQEVTPRRGGLG